MTDAAIGLILVWVLALILAVAFTMASVALFLHGLRKALRRD